MPSPPERLIKQIAFIAEADKMKNVCRRSYISDRSRHENDAEHSWHFCLMAIILLEHANEPDLDLLKILKMAIIHDIVEIDAGDTYIYDEVGKQTQYEKESLAADRLFGMLPEDQERAYRALWEEFEAGDSKEAIFAKTIDRMHPMLLNYLAEGKAWHDHGVTAEDVRRVNGRIERGSEQLWQFAESLIEECVEKGWLLEVIS